MIRFNHNNQEYMFTGVQISSKGNWVSQLQKIGSPIRYINIAGADAELLVGMPKKEVINRLISVFVPELV